MAMFIEILAALGRYSDFSPSPIVALEKGEGVPARDDAGALVV
jgi:hypothetical protein